MARKRSKHLFIFGTGFSARAIATLALQKGWSVSGTTRSTDNFDALSSQGIQPHLFPVPGSESSFELPKDVTHVLISIPPGKKGDPALSLLESTNPATLKGIEWLGYLSTTGVYGDWQGGWVDEASVCKPSLERTKRRLETEAAWMNSGLPAHIFRLAGIYGPARNSVENVMAGTARRIDKPGQIFCRIHVSDIAMGIVASMDAPAVTANQSIIFNMADDEPAPNHQVVTHAAELLGVDAPPLVLFDQAGLSPMAQSFYSECRRVNADKIKTHYGLKWQYPTYRQGMEQCLGALKGRDKG